MKTRIIIAAFICSVIAGVYGQYVDNYPYGIRPSPFESVQDTTNIDKTLGRAIVFEGKYYVGTGSALQRFFLHGESIAELDVSAWIAVVDGIRPSSDNAGHVGTASYKFDEGWINYLCFKALTGDTLLPESGNGTLGKSGNEFKELHATNIYTGYVRASTQIVDQGTGGSVLASGTTYQRAEVLGQGMIRYNTTTDRFEYYKWLDGWKSIAELGDLDDLATTDTTDALRSSIIGLQRIDSLNANNTWDSQNIYADTAGENLSYGDCVYMKSDGKFWLSDTTDTLSMVRAMALESISADDVGDFLLISGTVRNDSWSWTQGATLYLGNDGGMSETPPSTSDQLVHVVAWAIAPNKIVFKPSMDWIVLK